MYNIRESWVAFSVEKEIRSFDTKSIMILIA